MARHVCQHRNRVTGSSLRVLRIVREIRERREERIIANRLIEWGGGIADMAEMYAHLQ